MSPKDFEMVISKDYQSKGYSIEHTGKAYDKGVDLIAQKGKERIAIQVKMYKDRIVRYQEIMYLFAGMKLFDCSNCMLITTNAIEDEAKRIAAKLGVDFHENYVIKADAHQNILGFSSVKKETDFFNLWTEHIMLLQGQELTTQKGNKNLILEVTPDYVFRKSSKGKESKIGFNVFETIYHRLLLKKRITRDEINIEYPGRAASIIIVILAQLPNIQIMSSPTISIQLQDGQILP